MKKENVDSSLEPLEFQAKSQLFFEGEKLISFFGARTKKKIEVAIN